MEISATTLNLLVKLCSIRKQMRWQIRCNYFAAEGDAVFNILFYDIQNNHLKGDIAFWQPSEKVVDFRFLGYQSEKPENLIDLLLDLINYEKSILSDANN
ncbi:MAG: hypothetical protein SFU27_03845 [Thermonemataceae bacterium]|nr:hypothetical protein [Thermonemataceae bacterium]